MGKLAKSFNHEYLLFILGVAITLFNTVNLKNEAVALLSIPQFVLVFYFIFNNNYRVAFLLHAVFIIACVSWGTVIEGELSPFLYTNCRIFGPLTLNIIILAALWFGVRNKTIKVDKDSLLLSFRNIILYILVSGSLIGLIGLFFIEHYDWHYWINVFLFVFESYIFIDIFIRLYDAYYSKLIAITTVCMIAAAPIASVTSYIVFGVHSYYGYEEIPLSNPIIGLTPCLIIALFQLNNYKLKSIALIGLIFYVIHIMILSRGSQFLDILVVLLLLGYLVYFKKSDKFQLKSLRLFLPIIIALGIPLAIAEVTASSDVSFKKFEQFLSLFTVFDFSNNKIAFNIEEVGSSPYIRVGELANIINEGLHNIFALFFGKGFGGYYTDSLHLFAGIDLSQGAFSDASAASGRLYNAHSAIPSLLHYNGLIGLFFMIKLAFNYLRRVDKTFLVFAAFVLFIQSFYFDMYGCFSYILALFGSEFLISSSSKKEVL